MLTLSLRELYDASKVGCDRGNGYEGNGREEGGRKGEEEMLRQLGYNGFGCGGLVGEATE